MGASLNYFPSSCLQSMSMKSMWNINKLKEPYFQILIFLLAIYVIFVFLLTLNPFRFSLVYLHQYLQFRFGFVQSIAGKIHIYDILLNLVMLFPVGFILGILWRIFEFNSKRAVLLGTAAGFLMSASIEFAQIFLPRTSSVVDVLTNTMGCSAAVMVAFVFRKQQLDDFLQNLYFKEKSFYLWIVIAYSVIATSILLIPSYFNHFGNWNNDYQLLVGNEKTLNRPWQGSVYKISIFNKALSGERIEAIYERPYSKKTPGKFAAGLVAEYIFNTVPVINRGYLGEEMDLYSQQPPLNNFEDDSSFVLKNNNVLMTKNGTSRFIQFLKDANRLTILVWLKPLTLQQSGPARIVSLSTDCNNRNFTLGQSGGMLNFRVRSPLAGNNGSRISLQSKPVLTCEEPQFVAATYHRGEMELYHNGALLPEIIYDTSPYLPLLIGLREDRFGKIIFCFMLLFPLGWIARGLSYRPKIKFLLSGAIVLVPFAGSSLIKMLHFKHTLDVHLLLAVTGVAVLAAVSGLVFDILKRYIPLKFF